MSFFLPPVIIWLHFHQFCMRLIQQRPNKHVCVCWKIYSNERNPKSHHCSHKCRAQCKTAARVDVALHQNCMEKQGASGANRHNCRMTTAMLCCKPWTSNISNVLLLEELRTDSLIGFLRGQHQLACSSDSRSSPTPWYLQIRPKIA